MNQQSTTTGTPDQIKKMETDWTHPHKAHRIHRKDHNGLEPSRDSKVRPSQNYVEWNEAWKVEKTWSRTKKLFTDCL